MMKKKELGSSTTAKKGAFAAVRKLTSREELEEEDEEPELNSSSRNAHLSIHKAANSFEGFGGGDDFEFIKENDAFPPATASSSVSSSSQEICALAERAIATLNEPLSGTASILALEIRPLALIWASNSSGSLIHNNNNNSNCIQLLKAAITNDFGEEMSEEFVLFSHSHASAREIHKFESYSFDSSLWIAKRSFRWNPFKGFCIWIVQDPILAAKDAT